MLPHPLKNFEVQKFCWKKLNYYDVCSRNNSPKEKNGAYVIDLDEYNSI